MVEDALQLGYDISIIQKGQTNADLFPSVKRYLGDRINITSIVPATEKWDVVIDTCGYHPEVVKKSADYFKDKARLYIFISTISTYKDFSEVGITESSPVSSIEIIPSIDTKITAENYGPLKVLCENAVVNAFGEKKSLILRPTLIVGKYDLTNRFDYWIKSIMNESTLDVPDDNEICIQYVDVRALSQFALSSHDKKRSGVYNTIGSNTQVKLIDFLNKTKAILNPSIQFNFIADKSKTFPIYVPEKGMEGFFKVSCDKAFADGFQLIPLEDTIRSAADFLKTK